MMDKLENWAINAYADDELDAAEQAAVEKELANNPDAQRVLNSIQSQKTSLKRAYDAVLSDPLPPELLRSLQQDEVRPRRQWFAIAASVVMLLTGSAGTYVAMKQFGVGSLQVAEAFNDRAVNAHLVYAVDFKHPVEVGAKESEHLQSWLSKRVGVDFKIPDLSTHGFSFIGGRLLAEDGTPAGLLMYENAGKQRLSIYVAANTGLSSSPMLIEHKGELTACYWVEPDMVYAVVGAQKASVMVPLAETAHEGFDS
jgi:anti-sigma factor RsiW